MGVCGITKVRNEAHIIQDTLDSWHPICDLGIHVYDDSSTDGTAEICRSHLAVTEVVTSDRLDPDRERAEWYNRNLILQSARRFLGDDDWVVYFDGDEHLEMFDAELLTRSELKMIALMSFDVYITDEDAHLEAEDYAQRRFVSPEFELCPYFYRNSQPLRFYKPDQRNIDLQLEGKEAVLSGSVRHWGKGISVKKWEEKCEYYATVFGSKYAEKWDRRRGQAVHEVSDFGNPLVPWTDIRDGVIEPMTTRLERKGVPVT